MINNVVLVGRLTKDPDLKYTSSGSAVASFTLAVNRNFTNQNGNREADFINCVIWRKPAETMANYAHKGTLLGVVGRIQTRSYDNQQGERVYVTEVVCENFQLLESKSTNETRNSAQSSQDQNTGGSNGFTDNYGKDNQNGANRTSGGQNDTSGFNRDSDPFGGSRYQSDDSDGLPF